MYADAYPSVMPAQRLEQLARATAPCWGRHDRRRAWACAVRAVGDGLCPCLALAAGGTGGDGEHAIVMALADEMKHQAERRVEDENLESQLERPVARA